MQTGRGPPVVADLMAAVYVVECPLAPAAAPPTTTRLVGALVRLYGSRNHSARSDSTQLFFLPARE